MAAAATRGIRDAHEACNERRGRARRCHARTGFRRGADALQRRKLLTTPLMMSVFRASRSIEMPRTLSQLEQT